MLTGFYQEHKKDSKKKHVKDIRIFLKKKKKKSADTPVSNLDFLAILNLKKKRSIT